MKLNGINIIESNVTITKKVKVGERCICLYAFSFNIQCRHEIAIYNEFRQDLFSKRWLNTLTYNSQTSKKLSSIHNILIDQDHGITNYVSCVDNDNIISHIDVVSDNYTQVEPISDISYQTELGRCEILLKLISHDKQKLFSFHNTLTETLERARNNVSINTYFGSDVPMKSYDPNNILPGTLGNIPNARNKKRLQSRTEFSYNNARCTKRSSTVNDNVAVSNILQKRTNEETFISTNIKIELFRYVE